MHTATTPNQQVQPHVHHSYTTAATVGRSPRTKTPLTASHERTAWQTERLKERVTQFYERHSPGNLQKVDAALSLRVSERKLFALLRRKYGVRGEDDDGAGHRHVGMPEGDGGGSAASAEALLHRSAVLLPAVGHFERTASQTERLKERVTQFYGHYSPQDLHKVEHALSLPLSEDELFALLRRKYGVRGEDDDGAGHRHVGMPEGDGGGSAASAEALLHRPAVLLPAVGHFERTASQTERLKERVTQFYGHYSPQDLQKVEHALSLPLSEDELFALLRRKYGVRGEDDDGAGHRHVGMPEGGGGGSAASAEALLHRPATLLRSRELPGARVNPVMSNGVPDDMLAMVEEPAMLQIGCENDQEGRCDTGDASATTGDGGVVSTSSAAFQKGPLHPFTVPNGGDASSPPSFVSGTSELLSSTLVVLRNPHEDEDVSEGDEDETSHLNLESYAIAAENGCERSPSIPPPEITTLCDENPLLRPCLLPPCGHQSKQDGPACTALPPCGGNAVPAALVPMLAQRTISASASKQSRPPLSLRFPYRLQLLVQWRERVQRHKGRLLPPPTGSLRFPIQQAFLHRALQHV